MGRRRVLGGFQPGRRRMTMVKIYSDDGVYVGNEPPYTEEEEMDFYRRIGGGPVSILHAPKSAAPTPPKSSKPLREE
jgi:hypothetical protein